MELCLSHYRIQSNLSIRVHCMLHLSFVHFGYFFSLDLDNLQFKTIRATFYQRALIKGPAGSGLIFMYNVKDIRL